MPRPKRLEDTNRTQNNRDPERTFLDICEKFQIRNFLFLDLNLAGEPLSRMVIYSNWPDGLLEKAREFSIQDRTELPDLANASLTPFHWRYQTTDSKAINLFEELLEASCLLEGLVIPVHGPNSELSVAILNGYDYIPSSSQMGALFISAANIIEAYQCRKRVRVTETISTLSKRELACVRWAALGKTSFETSKILDLSEFTVDNYIASACKRLGVPTRCAAVAMFVKLGLVLI